MAAFTFVELCASVAVVAVLIILTGWATSSLRQTAAIAKSTGNLRQISSGLSAYTIDQDGYLPESALEATVKGTKVNYWFNALSYYIDGRSDFAAMEASATRPAWQNCPGRIFKTPEFFNKRCVSVGYGWNHQFFGSNGGSDDRYRYGWKSRLAEVELPSQTIIIGTNREERAEGEGVGVDGIANIYIYASNPNSTRFNGAGLYLFVDGSVKRMTPAQASYGATKDSKEYRYLFKKKKSGLPYPEDNRPK